MIESVIFIVENSLHSTPPPVFWEIRQLEMCVPPSEKEVHTIPRPLFLDTSESLMTVFTD